MLHLVRPATRYCKTLNAERVKLHEGVTFGSTRYRVLQGEIGYIRRTEVEVTFGSTRYRVLQVSARTSSGSGTRVTFGSTRERVLQGIIRSIVVDFLLTQSKRIDELLRVMLSQKAFREEK